MSLLIILDMSPFGNSGYMFLLGNFGYIYLFSNFGYMYYLKIIPVDRNPNILIITPLGYDWRIFSVPLLLKSQRYGPS